MRSLKYKDVEAARLDAAASAAHYLRAYFLCGTGELDVDVVLDSLDEIRKWMMGYIFALKNRG
ncbi:MAG: hypothetical protein MIO93_12050 [ANME-2 cluster archaeon]|nr:hypothetical protein [ANME-2 cluster archaeon]